MPIDPVALSSLADEYTLRMTRIRGRRVQRLLKREFAGADHLLLVQTGSGTTAVLGLSDIGAAICSTDGTGKHAGVFKWAHDATAAIETRFDLRKDSLPALATSSMPINTLREQTRLQANAESVPPEARPWMSKVLRALA